MGLVLSTLGSKQLSRGSNALFWPLWTLGIQVVCVCVCMRVRVRVCVHVYIVLQLVYKG